MSLSILFIISIAVINLTLGFVIFTRNKQNFANKAFLSVTIFSTLWMLANFFLANTNKLELVNIFNGIAYSFGFMAIYSSLLFALSYPIESSFVKNKAYVYSSLLIAVAFSIVAETKYFAGVGYKNENGEILFTTGTLENIYAILALLIVIAIATRSIYLISKTNGIERSQAIYIMLALAASIIVAITGNLILPLLGLNVNYAIFAPFTSLIVISLISYAIIKHQLFDIRLVVARAIAYGASIGIIVAIFIGGSLLIGNRLAEDSVDSLLLLFYSIISVLLALAFQPVKRFFDKYTNKIFYRDSYDAQEFLNSINAKIVTSNDLYELLSQTANDIKNTIKVEHANFYIDSSAAIDFHTAGTNTSIFAKTEWSDLLADVNELDKKVITSESLELDEATIKLMRKLNIEIVLKMTSKEESVGYVILGERKSGTNFGLQDIQVLEIIADELAITVQNAIQLEQIAQFNVTLQRKIDNATNELQQSNEKLVKLDEAKDEFISMASHQLRTPLTSVKGYISMILEGDAGEINETQKKFLDQAYISSQRMVYLIADLLNVSRLKTGKFVIEKSPTYLPDVVESEVSQLFGTAEARDLKMIFHKPESFPTIDLDETKIRQVIMNFADNAIYYTPHGGKITIALKKLKNSIEYTVTDTGIGVPKSEQHHLFNKFYRAANAKKARPDGTGLGLYMAKKVVVAQGGAIIFKTTEGKGSTFGFSFPLPKDAPKEESEEKPDTEDK